MPLTPQKSAIEPVLTAFVSALNVAAMTALALGGIHNGLPATVTYPFGRVGDAYEQIEDAMGVPGRTVLVRLHWFDRAKTDLAISRMVSKAQELLTHVALTVTGFTWIATQYEQTYPAGTEDINGVEVRHAVSEFRVTVRQA